MTTIAASPQYAEVREFDFPQARSAAAAGREAKEIEEILREVKIHWMLKPSLLFFIGKPNAVTTRLEELKRLQRGWLDGKGLPLSGSGVDWLASAFRKFYASPSLPPPYIYPTAEGGVRAEWSVGSREISLEVDLANHLADWHVLDMASGHEAYDVLCLDKDSAWQAVKAEIQRD